MVQTHRTLATGANWRDRGNCKSGHLSLLRLCQVDTSSFVFFSLLNQIHVKAFEVEDCEFVPVHHQQKLYKRNRPKGPKIPLNLTSEGLKYPPEVRVEHKTCSTICGTPVQAILDEIFLTRLAGGVREGQNMAQNAPYAIKKMA